jgi:hypothetical protein
MAQAVSRRPPSVDAWFRFRVSTRGVCGGQSDLRIGFPLVFWSSPVNFISVTRERILLLLLLLLLIIIIIIK